MLNFANEIISWYSSNKRDLPWRNTENPYYIWLSEVILQQTRVNQGLSYYLKFISLFPTVFDLANASEDEVLKAWEGLGYYSRARNLHFAAKSIVCDFNGVFPNKYSEIRELKGVGDYTAAAIASFAFNLPYPVLDGNVMRVLSRFWGIFEPIDTKEGKFQIIKTLTFVFDENRPLLFNQAIMEFGALQCVPASPACDSCIFSIACEAKKSNNVQLLPIKSKKVKIKNRFFYYLVPFGFKKLFIQKRESNDIWKGLYQFPLLETDDFLTMKELEDNTKTNFKANVVKVSEPLKHILTHQHINILFVEVEFDKFPMKYQEINFDEVMNFPFPIVLANYIEKRS